MDYKVIAYLAYAAISASFTIWVARTLHKNGRIFLVDAFGGNGPLADSVNHLLVVGFCLINFGYDCFSLKNRDPVDDARSAIESLSTQVGAVLLVLGGMHFINLYIFNRMRRRGTVHQIPPPLAPIEALRVKALGEWTGSPSTTMRPAGFASTAPSGSRSKPQVCPIELVPNRCHTNDSPSCAPRETT